MYSWTSRFYERESDLQQMQDFLMEARALSADWRYSHVGELVFRFLTVARHLNPTAHIRLWHVNNKLVGYAIVSEDPQFDFQVHPDYEWRGIEAEALAWAEALIGELCRSDPPRWGSPCVSGARQDNAPRRAFLEEHGFRLGGEFSEVNMLHPLDEPILTAQAPAGCQVRSLAAAAGEISERAAAHRDVWLPWTDGNISADDYLYFMQLPGYQQNLDIVAVTPGGVIAAFVNGWIDPRNKIGDLGEVGTRPAYRRLGLMRAVLLECLRRMQACGMNRACVSTGVSNTPAIRLYESLGFKIVNQYLEYVRIG